jgi:3-deoxy-D-manno-octulosonic-acid transferase
MRFFYGIFIFIFTLSFRLAALSNEKARRWVEGRKDFFRRLEKLLQEKDPEKKKKRAWFHCASLGEFEQGRPVIESYRKKYPDHLLILTFFSPSGYEIRKNYPVADIVTYLPADTSHNSRAFVSLVDPAIAVFVKYEFWYNYLYRLGKNGTAVYFISVILRPSQVFFRWYGKWFLNNLKAVKTFFVQNADSLKLLVSAGFDNVIISGDTRFDRVSEITQNPLDLPLVKDFCGNDKVIVAGSTWPQDERLILNATKKLGLKLIIAPHETSPARIKEIISAAGRPVLLYSSLQKDNPGNAGVLIIDTIGILSSLYRYGNIAYIGGGFGAGIHNILEAAAYGVPVIFGPNHEKFREATDLINLGGGYMIENEEQLVRILVEHSENSRNGSVCTKYVSDHRGATACIMSHL